MKKRLLFVVFIGALIYYHVPSLAQTTGKVVGKVVDENTGKVLLQLNNIRDDGLLDMHKKYFISHEDYKIWISRIEVKEGDCIITNVGRVGAVAIIPRGVSAAIGRNMTVVDLVKAISVSQGLINHEALGKISTMAKELVAKSVMKGFIDQGYTEAMAKQLVGGFLDGSKL